MQDKLIAEKNAGVRIKRVWKDKAKGEIPMLIAGPCSAESEEQVLATAKAMAEVGVDWFRAGIWKPRTRPGGFAGMGEPALRWLEKVKSETGLKVTTEVANASHVEAALAHGVDMLWIGARSTGNPFTVQEIADALQGVKVDVMVKNPLNPDVDLWLGAIERVQKSVQGNIYACHRGFNVYGKSALRNEPLWEIPLELKRRIPQIQVFCDPSHICGNREYLADISQKSIDLGFSGLMIETHHQPDQALSDAFQQITPLQLEKLLAGLSLRLPDSNDIDFKVRQAILRQEIDEVDQRIVGMLAERMELSRKMGKLKNDNHVIHYHHARWSEILENVRTSGDKVKLPAEFVEKIFNQIHLESIEAQSE